MKKDKSKSSFLVGDLTVEQILESIDFDDEAVEHAARTLPKLFLEAAQYRVRTLRRRQVAERALDAARVDAAMAARQAAIDAGKKITEVALKELVEHNTDVRENQRTEHECRKLEEFAKLLLECLRMKKSAVQVVTEMKGAERAVERYFEAVQSKEGMENMRARAREKYADAKE